ncbi:MAG TPA: GNAT family N-acetyltransferase [Solirubrobacteraceae bacterium]|nr:GNAT family N-acetyltransferase [Solirubrobacteraceae bacterium]
MPTPEVLPRALVWATDIQVLPPGRVLERRDGYLVVRSPENPAHHWGNFLLFDDPPAAGDGARWEHLFEAEFASTPGVGHRAFGWDRPDGALGEACAEFAARAYELEQTVGLRARAGAARPHPRQNRDVTIAALDPRPGAEPELWEQVVEMWVASSEVEPAQEHTRRAFVRIRLGELRALFMGGMGSWYVALDGGGREVVGCCGIVTSGTVGRFQSVDTRADWRRRGVCSRLLVEACRHCERHHSVECFVIAADAGYHALGIYESLGFEPVERVAGVCLDPSSPRAAGAPAGDAKRAAATD